MKAGAGKLGIFVFVVMFFVAQAAVAGKPTVSGTIDIMDAGPASLMAASTPPGQPGLPSPAATVPIVVSPHSPGLQSGQLRSSKER